MYLDNYNLLFVIIFVAVSQLRGALQQQINF